VGPVLEQRLEHPLYIVAVEILDVLPVLLAVAAVVEPGEDVDVAVMIRGAENVVEIDGAVEEAPGQIADHRAQKQVHRHRMSATRPRYIREILIAFELESAQREIPIAKIVDLTIGLARRPFCRRHYSVLQ